MYFVSIFYTHQIGNTNSEAVGNRQNIHTDGSLGDFRPTRADGLWAGLDVPLTVSTRQRHLAKSPRRHNVNTRCKQYTMAMGII